MQLPSGEHEAAGRRPISWMRLLAVGAGTVLASTVANALIARALAGALQVPSAYPPLQIASVASSTIVGVAGAVLVFALLARVRPNPVAAFRLVAAIVLVVSWVPDLLVLATHPFPGTSLPAVLSQMLLHVVAAGLSVLLLGQYGLASGRRAS